jgi:hypothetical protein
MTKRATGETIAETPTTTASWDDDEDDATEAMSEGNGAKIPPNGSDVVAAAEEPAADIPNPDAGDDLDEFERYAVSDVVTSRSGEAVTCIVGTPNKLHFFRCPADQGLYRAFSFLVFEDGGKKRTYLIDGRLKDLPEFEGRLKVGRTTPYITHHGSLGLWLLSIEHDDNPWVASGLRIAEAAKGQWVVALPVKAQSAYRMLPAERDFGEPDWPDLKLGGWMKLAFPDELRINSPDHPIAKVLRGA